MVGTAPGKLETELLLLPYFHLGAKVSVPRAPLVAEPGPLDAQVYEEIVQPLGLSSLQQREQWIFARQASDRRKK